MKTTNRQQPEQDVDAFRRGEYPSRALTVIAPSRLCSGVMKRSRTAFIDPDGAMTIAHRNPRSQPFRRYGIFPEFDGRRAVWLCCRGR